MINQQLRAARAAQDLTLADLSRRTGIAAPNLSRIERGEIDPRWSTVERIAQSLGLAFTLTPQASTSMADIKRRMSSGARRLDAAGVSERNADARLMWKDSRGIDTSVERSQLDGR